MIHKRKSIKDLCPAPASYDLKSFTKVIYNLCLAFERVELLQSGRHLQMSDIRYAGPARDRLRDKHVTRDTQVCQTKT